MQQQGKSAPPRVQQVSLLMRTTWIAAGFLFVAIALGCMNLGIGERTVVLSNNDAPGQQSSTLTLGPAQELDVYYPIPYVYTPNLQTECEGKSGVILVQQADHFRIKNPGKTPQEVTWTARGVQVATSTTAPISPGQASGTPVVATPGQPVAKSGS